MRVFLARFLGGFDRYSVIALLAMAGVLTWVFGRWWRMILAQNLRDGLLWSIWGVMTVLACWRVRLRTDAVFAFTGGVGGFLIEWWGTNTGVWHYFTHDRPPLFILPAWMVSAVVINRVGTAWVPAVPESRKTALEVAYWVILCGFTVAMVRFLWPFVESPLTWGFIAVTVSIPWVARRPSEDLLLFGAGTLAGVFFEYWGTSRQCWTYYTGEVPPWVAVFAHGFAAVAFAHAVRVLGWICNSPKKISFQ